MKIELSFPRSYSLQVLDALPVGAPLRYFPPNRAAGQDGLIVRVEPNDADAWIGMFAFGNIDADALTYAGTMPDLRKFYVASRGAGYIIDAANPSSWEEVSVIPVMDSRAVPAAGIVVFANYTELVAYDVDGLKWSTKRLAWDGLRILEVSAHTIVGEYWDIRSEAMERFEVDLATGTSRGGVEA